MLIRIILVFFLLALLETINGIARIKILYKFLTPAKAGVFSFITGTIFIILIIYNTLTYIGAKSYKDCLIAGFLWAFLMAAYDILLGKYVFKLSWKKIASDFDPRQGNLLGIGMLLIIFAPAVIFYFQ